MRRLWFCFLGGMPRYEGCLSGNGAGVATEGWRGSQLSWVDFGVIGTLVWGIFFFSLDTRGRE